MKEKKSSAHPTHGDSNSRLYHIFYAMHQRCENPKNTGYKNYGGRGISVCPEWKVYVVFREWALSNGYTDELTIDRIDNSTGYSPSNCRWATWKEQAVNKRPRKPVEMKHPSHNAYCKYKCRCEKCVAFKSEYLKRMRKAAL